MRDNVGKHNYIECNHELQLKNAAMDKRKFIFFSLFLSAAFLIWLLVDSLSFMPKDGTRIYAREAELSQLMTGRDDPETGIVTREILPEERLDLNTASVEDLQRLEGIGPALAEAIVRDREENGSFQSVDDLIRVSGIGEKRLEAIRDHVEVGG